MKSLKARCSQTFFALPQKVIRNNVETIQKNPRISIGVNAVFSQKAEKKVAATGSMQAYRLAFSGPMSFTPCIYNENAMHVPKIIIKARQSRDCISMMG